MLAYWEEEFPVSTSRAEDSSTISCISWTGADKTDILSKTGWLVTGSSDGTVSITSTSTIPHGKAGREETVIGSYNLQHIHLSQIAFVKFNKAMNILASCDTQGGICVWSFSQKMWVCKCVKALGNVGSRVTDLIWCTQGLLAVIHHPAAITMFNVVTLRATTYPLGIETGHNQVHITISPCNGFIYLGTDQGEVQIIGLTNITTHHLRQVKCSVVQVCCSQENTLAIGFSDGIVILMNCENIEHVVYKELDTVFKSYLLAWSESNKYLAVLGNKQEGTHLQLYSRGGELLVNLTVPKSIKTNAQNGLAMTWGHGDTRVFVTTGTNVAVVRVVVNNSANLMEMSSIKIYTNGWKSVIMSSQTLPTSIKLMLSHFMTNTIYDPISLNCTSAKDFNIHAFATPGGCIYCTMKHNKLQQLYTLYLERLGKMVPLLEARQVGCVRPMFVIYDKLARDKNAREEDTSESHILARVHSNLWGTRFKIVGTRQNQKFLTKVKYKPSLIHWQPRKMTLKVTNPDKMGNSYTVSDLLKEEQTAKLSMNTGEDRIKLHNCSPQWNSEYNIFQLDCRGRITIESEKNFQFYFSEMLVLQFGRVGEDTYTLDFNYPFSAIQAFGIALTSLTHRLK